MYDFITTALIVVGEVLFNTLYAGYSSSVPIWYLRLVPAVSGSLLPIAVYYLVMEFKFSRWTAAFAAAVIIMGMISMNFVTLCVCL